MEPLIMFIAIVVILLIPAVLHIATRKRTQTETKRTVTPNSNMKLAVHPDHSTYIVLKSKRGKVQIPIAYIDKVWRCIVLSNQVENARTVSEIIEDTELEIWQVRVVLRYLKTTGKIKLSPHQNQYGQLKGMKYVRTAPWDTHVRLTDPFSSLN